MRTQPDNLNLSEPGSGFIDSIFMKNILMQAPIGIFFLKGPQLLLEFLNETIQDIIAKPLHQILHKAIWDIVPEARTQEHIDLCNRVLYKGEKIELKTCPFLRFTKETKGASFLNAIYAPFHEDDGAISGIIVYYTESMPVSTQIVSGNDSEKSKSEGNQKPVDLRTLTLTEEKVALQQKEERYHRMVNEVQDYAIIYLDKNGFIQNWNKGAFRIIQYNETEVIGKHFRMFYFPKDRLEHLPELLLARAIKEDSFTNEGWRLRKDGTKFWGSTTITALHNEKNETFGFSKVTRDLTERKIVDDQLLSAAEELLNINEALKKSEDRYHKMIAEVQDYAIILLDEEGCVQNWNAGAENILGYKSDEIVGKNFHMFYTDSDRNHGLPGKLLKEAADIGKAVYEGWRVRKDGSEFWGSIVISALHSDDGTVIGFSKVTRDLTERKKAADKMQEYMHELEAQNKELAQFAYIASHDLQEPLRKIQTFAELIEINIRNEEVVTKYFEKIKSSAAKMTELIKSVLQYSQLAIDRHETVDIDLNAIITDLLEDFELLIREKSAVIKSEKLPVIKAIPSQINQLFSNLISNAFKYNDKEPLLEISSRLIGRNEIINCPDKLSDDKYYHIMLKDNGIGFDQKYEKVIFSMFQRLHGKQQYAGTGIGLAMCNKIMENHRGFITAESEVSKGAVFNVYFPER